jgi:hypothetical protein
MRLVFSFGFPFLKMILYIKKRELDGGSLWVVGIKKG